MAGRKILLELDEDEHRLITKALAKQVETLAALARVSLTVGVVELHRTYRQLLDEVSDVQFSPSETERSHAT